MLVDWSIKCFLEENVDGVCVYTYIPSLYSHVVSTWDPLVIGAIQMHQMVPVLRERDRFFF